MKHIRFALLLLMIGYVYSGDLVKPFANAYLPFPMCLLIIAPLLFVGGRLLTEGR